METYPELGEFPQIAATWAYTMPPAMGIPIMAGLTPKDIQWHVQDQNIEKINFDDDSDLIAISFFTPQSGYAYELGDEFKKRGKTVIMGGMHPSMIPDDVALHCDSVCIGEVDTVWLTILEDFKNGKLKKVYQAEKLPEGDEIASPLNGIFDVEDKYDWHASLLSVTRGCPFNCSWCNIPIYQGCKTRFRPMDKVVEDMRKLSGKEFYVTDDMIMLKRKEIKDYMMELSEKVKDFNLNMFLSCSPAMNTDPDFLDAIAKAGAKSMYTVFAADPFSKMFFEKSQRMWQKAVDLVKELEDRGIRFFASFGVGFDFQKEDQFDYILEFCQKANVKTAEFFIATPFPNTPFWKQIQEENRFILPRNWKKYNCANVVFKPKHTTEDQLRDGFVYLWKEFFKVRDHSVALETFHQKAENILKSKEFSEEVKNMVRKGLEKSGYKFGE
ncbi:MAG: hypothetical protein A2086_01950 [Spirochaetes bacterium GWD1_27_9]|nr:MAG: hypothetical protein A2086_01950 [Spirochaetes bacterium GWD1_27_9]